MATPLSTASTVEEQLKAAETRFRMLVDHASDGIFIAGVDGRYQDVNPAGCAMLGYSRDEMLTLSFRDVLVPDECPRLAGEVERLMNGVTVRSEWRFRRKDGSIFFGELSGCQLPDARLLGVVRDISDRKHVEERLRESETHLLASQRIAAVGSWEMDLVSDDLSSNPVRWSAECHRLLGYGPDDREMSSDAFYRRVHPADRQKIGEAIRRAVATGTRYSIDHRILLDDGTERILHQQAERVEDATARTAKFIGTTQDITDRVRLEEQLRQSQKMQAIGQLAGGVAHDFNNLLTVINGYSEMLLLDRPESDPTRHELAAIRDAGERAAQLTRQLLLFSRKAVFEPRVLDLNDLVQQAGVMLRRLIAEDIDLTLTLAPMLPGIKADPSQLEQLVLNLALNARDAMTQGGRLTIETRVVTLDESFCRVHPQSNPGRFVRLVVGDTGCGMTAETRAHLFEPFFTTKGPGRGTGLGLATVYGIVQESGGFITVASEVGAGTTMSVFLPAIAVTAPHSMRFTMDDSVPGGHETVLLVEDEEAVRGVATLALTMHGYRVLAASSGAAALRMMESLHEAVDLLVTDVVMPEMSGGQLAQSMRARYPECRVLFMSGYNEDIAIRLGQHGRHDGFLQKPFTPLLLAKRVRELLDQPV